MELVTEIEIAAPVHVVWAELTAFEAYPEWNPFIRKIEGRLSTDEQLRVRIEPPGGRAMTFTPKVLVADANTELRWIGKFLLPGLFDGEHSFHLEVIERDVTKFTQRDVQGTSRPAICETTEPLNQKRIRDDERGVESKSRIARRLEVREITYLANHL